MKWLDWVQIVGLLVACTIPMVVMVLAAMRFEQYRVRRALATFTAGIDGARSEQVRGPGAWQLTEIEGRRAGCVVTLGPKVLGSGAMVDVGTASVRLKTMGYELRVRGPAPEDAEVRVDLDLPVTAAAARRALALVDTIAATLTRSPTG